MAQCGQKRDRTSAVTRSQFILLYAAMWSRPPATPRAIGHGPGSADLACPRAGGDELQLVGCAVGIAGALLGGEKRSPWPQAADHRRVAAFRRGDAACGFALLAGLHCWIAPALTFALFAVFRSLRRARLRDASATQAYLSSKTRRSGRVVARCRPVLVVLIGHDHRPRGRAPVRGSFRPVGPLFAFALIGAAVLFAIARWLTDDRLGRRVGRRRGKLVSSLASPPTGASASPQRRRAACAPQMERSAHSAVDHRRGHFGHAQAAALDLAAFSRSTASRSTRAKRKVDLDCHDGRAGERARPACGQWGVIPRLSLGPRALILWGCGIAAAGLLMTVASSDLYGITLGFAVACLGFGFTRPGFTAGASLAVPLAEQGAVAGVVTAANGSSFVLAPTLGIALYTLQHSLPFTLSAALLMLFVAFGRGSLKV